MNEQTEKKPWKLFGKLNIIDILVIVAILAAGVLLSGRMLKKTGVTASAQHIRVQYYGFDDIKNHVPENLHVGDPITQYQTGVNMGTLVDFSYAPAYEQVYDPQRGEMVDVPVQGESFVWLTVECYGQLGPTGMTIEDTTFVIGGNFYLNVGVTRAGYQIVSFELID